MMRGRHARTMRGKNRICIHGPDARLEYVWHDSLADLRPGKTNLLQLRWGRNSRMATVREHLDMCYEDEGTPRDMHCLHGAASVVAHQGRLEQRKRPFWMEQKGKGLSCCDSTRLTRQPFGAIQIATADLGKRHVPRALDQISHHCHLTTPWRWLSLFADETFGWIYLAS